MQGSKLDALFQHLDHLIGNQYALVEPLSTVYHPVPDGVNLVERLDTAVFLAQQNPENVFDSCAVFQDLSLELHFLPVGESEFQERTFHSDLFHASLSNNLVAFHIEKLVLDGGTSAI